MKKPGRRQKCERPEPSVSRRQSATHDGDRDNAGFSLPAAAEEFGTGTFVGGLLSSGQATVHGITTSAQHAANGDAKLRAGEMPNDIELQAIGLSEPKARGMMVMYQMGNVEDSTNEYDVSQIVDLKPKSLMDELMNSGEKCSIDEVIVVTKTTDGSLRWLEQGNEKKGLTHIFQRHLNDFASQGVEDVPKLISEVLKTEPIKKGQNEKGPYADYALNGNTYRLAYGTNGYIVSFYPID